jgi:putative ABC transport system permease protein
MRCGTTVREPPMLKLALRNVSRQKGRTLATLAAVAFGVAALILGGGFVRDLYAQLGEALIHSQSGHIQLARADFFSSGSRFPEKYRLDDAAHLAGQIAQQPEVAQVLMRTQFSALLNNGHTDWPVVGEGVQPEQEARLGSYLKILEGRSLAAADAFGVMIGDGVAKALDVGPGDRVTLLSNTVDGALNTLDFEIIGIFQTFSRDFDARAVRIPLEASQELVGADGANTLVVELKRTANTDRFADALGARFAGQPIEVRTWVQLNDFFEKTVQLYETQFGVLQLIILAMVLLGVANSVNMSAFERIGEFGTMRSLGSRSREIFGLVVVESALLGLAGALLGCVLGALLAVVVSAIGIPMPPPPNANAGYRAAIRLAPDLVLWSAVVGFAGAVLASLVPAARVTRIPVVDALRYNV